jgi:hypothetical protein
MFAYCILIFEKSVACKPHYSMRASIVVRFIFQIQFSYRIKRFGRDDLNYQANSSKVHWLKETKTSFSFLASNKL